jgi:hypothetical protein
VVIIALGISYLKKPINFSNQKPLVIGILLLLSLILASLPKVVEKSLYSQSDVDTVLAISRDAHEYRPRWVPSEMFKSAPDSVSPGILETDPISKLGRTSPKASVTVGQGSLLIQRWKPREIVLQANAITDIWLTIKQFYYPGWTARINGESHLLPVKPSEPEGLLRVGVPLASMRSQWTGCRSRRTCCTNNHRYFCDYCSIVDVFGFVKPIRIFVKTL